MIWLIVLIFFALLLLAVGIIDGNRFVTVKEEFVLSGLAKECRFVMISDLHNKVYGKQNDKVIAAVKKINPDFIILAGDLITSKVNEEMTPGIRLVQTLSKDYKIYYGLGNHESKIKYRTDKFGDKFKRLKRELDSKNVIMLENESALIPEYNINVTGLELDLDYFAHFKVRQMHADYMEKTLQHPDESKCNILIAHNPDYFEEYVKWGADLILAGHVHGGIMRLPFLGGVIAPSYKLFPKYDGGVFRIGTSAMLLGRGMGSHTLPFRFFNPAELYEVVLKPEMK